MPHPCLNKGTPLKRIYSHSRGLTPLSFSPPWLFLTGLLGSQASFSPQPGSPYLINSWWFFSNSCSRICWTENKKAGKSWDSSWKVVSSLDSTSRVWFKSHWSSLACLRAFFSLVFFCLIFFSTPFLLWMWSSFLNYNIKTSYLQKDYLISSLVKSCPNFVEMKGLFFDFETMLTVTVVDFKASICWSSRTTDGSNNWTSILCFW